MVCVFCSPLMCHFYVTLRPVFGQKEHTHFEVFVTGSILSLLLNIFGWCRTLSLLDSLLPLLQNQFGYQDPNYSMEDMLATLPRVVSVPPVSGGCLPAQDLAAGGQMGAGFSRGKQDDPRCNGTLRKQASPRSNTLGTGTAPTAGLGKIKCYHTKYDR